MSRYYSMSVSITGADANRVDAVKQAVKAEWEFDDWQEHNGVLTALADGRLCGGETEDQFAERVAKAVWAANGAPCQINVTATYLEDLPYESYSLDESDYDRLVTANKEAADDG